MDVPPPGAGVNTVTVGVPAAAMSVDGMAAVSWVAETNVVARAAPFHRTTEPATKSVPVTVSVNPASPATAAVGFSPVVVGTGLVMLKVCGFDVPPPGAGLPTVTCAVPAVAMSAAGMAAVSRVAETNVVARSAPFHRTTEPLMKFVPVTVSVNPGPPAVAVAGLRPVVAGTGFEALPDRFVQVKLSRTSLAVVHLANPTAPAVLSGGGMNPPSQKSPASGCVLASCTTLPEAKAWNAVPSKRSRNPVSVTGLAPSTRRRRR